jgi:hypothetical protein
MTPQPVVAVAFWRYFVGPYRAAYGRFPSSKLYSKDYLQCSGSRRALDHALRRVGDQRVAVEYHWPGGGSRTGPSCMLRKAANDPRTQLAWPFNHAPDPWKVGNAITDPVVAIPGDPTKASEAEAEAELVAIEGNGYEPWLVAVALRGEPNALHVRAYLEQPPPGLELHATATLPSAIRQAMSGVGKGGSGGLIISELRTPDLEPVTLWFEPASWDSWRAASSDVTSARGAQPIGPVGAAYVHANEDVSSTAGEPFEVDPDERDRSTRAHNRTQNSLADILVRSGRDPRSPVGQPDFDLAWDEDENTTVVVEVKSVTAANAERQLRLGLGQVLRYRHQLASAGKVVRAVLALSDAPSDADWLDLCTGHDVGLIWLPDVPSDPLDWLLEL